MPLRFGLDTREASSRSAEGTDSPRRGGAWRWLLPAGFLFFLLKGVGWLILGWLAILGLG